MKLIGLTAFACVTVAAFGIAVGCGPSAPKGTEHPVSAEGGDIEARAFVECTLGFRVEFPITATGPLEHEIIDDAKHAAMVMRTGNGVGYSVTWTDLSAQKLTQSPMITLHEIEQLRLGKTGKIDDEREMSLPGGEALEFSFHRAEPRPETRLEPKPTGSHEPAAGGRVLLFLKGTTLYQIAALGDAGAGARPDAAVFVLSFKPQTCND